MNRQSLINAKTLPKSRIADRSRKHSPVPLLQSDKRNLITQRGNRTSLDARQNEDLSPDVKGGDAVINSLD